jgi:nucleotide-binding universal stress UspA family protein
MAHSPIILVPLDGSALAERAVRLACQLATAGRGKLILLRVLPISAGIATPLLLVSDPVADEARLVREAEAYLEQIAQPLRASLDVQTVVASGSAPEAILDEIALRNVGLIVMSTHGRSGIGRWVYGSVADEVMRRASVPVVLVPAHARPELADDRPPRLLVPLDGSDVAQEALGPAADLARQLGGQLTLLQVIVPPSYSFSEAAAPDAYDPTGEREIAFRYLDGLARDLSDRGFVAWTRDAVGPAADSIVGAAFQIGADLIVMSTHGHSGLARLVLGSVATDVIQQTAIPVVVYRPSAARVRSEAGHASAPM